jgi:ETFB lysine methyltransferase
MPPVHQYHSLRRRLAKRFRIVTETVTIGAASLVIRRPRSADELISPKDFEHDERLPYWAELWPSSVVLATYLSPARTGRLLELGCGLGLVTCAALTAGWDVVATDYYDDALQFTTLNALGTVGRKPETRLVDWRALPPPDVLGTFDAVVAADVLYERPYPELIANALGQTLKPSGLGIIVDPGRVYAPAFEPACEAVGLTMAVEREGSMSIYRVSRSALASPG